MSEFWDSGSIPSEAELRAYLRAQGVGDEDSNQIIREYADQIIAGNTTFLWTHEYVNEWVELKVNGAVAGDVAQTGPQDPAAMLDDIVSQRQSSEAALAAQNDALADQRTETAQRQVQSYYDQIADVSDQGAAYGASLATSIALGYQTDEYGNPVRDEYGQPIPMSAAGLWDEIRGQSFNMGSLSMPYDPSQARQRWYGQSASGRTSQELLAGYQRRKRPLDDSAQRYSSASGRTGAELMAGYEFEGDQRKRVLTPSQALAMLTSMDENYITRLQQEMWEAGLYERVAGEGAIPTWGQADVATRKALIEMFTEASVNPGESISNLLDRLSSERIQRMAAPEGGPGATGADMPDFTPEVTSAVTLGETIDEIARNLRGEFASDDERNTLIKTLQDKEINYQRQQYDRVLADAQEKSLGAGGEEVDRFMAAIAGKESGGNYNAVNADSGASGKFQIMPGNWGPWAERAGLGREAPRTPENQEIVARRIMLDYYAQFGNWRDVAVAWYSGPGNVARNRYSDRRQGKYPSINDYADDVMRRFAAQGVPQPGDPMYGSADMYGAIERFDPAAEARAILKAQDPAGWEAHEFANRAVDFYGLLGGVI